MPYCVAVGCSNNSFRKNREEDTSFYSFPKDDILKQKWIQNIKGVNLPNDPKICHYHFESSCFKPDLQVNTLFKHNADKQPQKGRSSMAKEEERAKRKLCTNASSHSKRIKDFLFVCNTKGTQMERSTFSNVYTQTECQVQ